MGHPLAKTLPHLADRINQVHNERVARGSIASNGASYSTKAEADYISSVIDWKRRGSPSNEVVALDAMKHA